MCVMLASDFRKIDEFFKRAGKIDLAPYAYVVFVENVESALSKSPAAKEAEKRQVCDQFLTETVLSSYLIVAEKRVETINASRPKSEKGFWMSVLSSIVGSFIFLSVIIGGFLIFRGPSQDEVTATVINKIRGGYPDE